MLVRHPTVNSYLLSFSLRRYIVHDGTQGYTNNMLYLSPFWKFDSLPSYAEVLDLESHGRRSLFCVASGLYVPTFLVLSFWQRRHGENILGPNVIYKSRLALQLATTWRYYLCLLEQPILIP